MVTDKERREIAEEIRKAAQHDFLGFPCFTSVTVERLFNLEIKGTILGVNSYTRESAMRMADLIEPEPERTCEWHQDENGLYHTSCGEIYETIAGTREENGIMFCPYCGREVVD